MGEEDYEPKLKYGPWTVNSWMYDEVEDIPVDYSKANRFVVPKESTMICNMHNGNMVPYEKIIKEKNIFVPKLFPHPEIEEHEYTPTGTRTEDKQLEAFLSWYGSQCKAFNLGGNDDLHAARLGFLFGIEYQKKLMDKGN